MTIPFQRLRPSTLSASMSLSRRFGIGFAVILALLLVVAFVSHLLLWAISGRVKSIVEVNNRQMALATTLNDQVNDMATTLAGMLAADPAATAQSELLERIQSFRKTTLPPIAEASRLGGDGQTMEAVIVLMRDVRSVEQQWRKMLAELAARSRRCCAPWR